MFFDFVRDYWWIVVVLYLILAFWSGVRWTWQYRSGKEKAWESFLADSLIGMFLYPFLMIWGAKRLRESSPIIGWILRNHKERVQRRLKRKKVERQHNFEYMVRKNKTTLYYNTINGVTAVLSVQSLYVAQDKTGVAREIDFWTHGSVMMPAKGTFVFLKKGAEENLEGRSWLVSDGSLEDLHRIITDFNVELKRDERIFVPYINKRLCDFADQKRMIGADEYRGREKMLVGLLLPNAPEWADPTSLPA